MLSTLYDAPVEPMPQPRGPVTPTSSSEPAAQQTALPLEERSQTFDGQPEEAPVQGKLKKAEMSQSACEVRKVEADALLDQAQQLFAAHWDEIALNKGMMVLKPDVERYQALEASGVLFALSAHVGDRLIGYSVNFLMRHLHYADLVYAQNDLLFIDKDYRASRAGLALIRATEAHAKAKGAQMLIWHAKPGTSLEALLPRMGYGVQDIMFSKEV